jgi:hypothetical protein
VTHGGDVGRPDHITVVMGAMVGIPAADGMEAGAEVGVEAGVEAGATVTGMVEIGMADDGATTTEA